MICWRSSGDPVKIRLDGGCHRVFLHLLSRTPTCKQEQKGGAGGTYLAIFDKVCAGLVGAGFKVNWGGAIIDAIELHKISICQSLV